MQCFAFFYSQIFLLSSPPLGLLHFDDSPLRVEQNLPRHTVGPLGFWELKKYILIFFFNLKIYPTFRQGDRIAFRSENPADLRQIAVLRDFVFERGRLHQIGVIWSVSFNVRFKFYILTCFFPKSFPFFFQFAQPSSFFKSNFYFFVVTFKVSRQSPFDALRIVFDEDVLVLHVIPHLFVRADFGFLENRLLDWRRFVPKFTRKAFIILIQITPFAVQLVFSPVFSFKF